MDPPYGGYFNRNEYGHPVGYPGASHGYPAASYGLPAGPRGPSFMGMGGTPGGSGLEGALQTIMPMLAESLREKMGGFGFNFGSDMNIVNSQYAREYNQQLNMARAAGAEQDKGQVSDLLRGLARMIGHRETGQDIFGQVRFRQPVEDAMGRMTGDISKMMPILAAMFPDQVDQFMPRGSMTVGAASFVSAGRFIIDPTTGRPISEDKDYGPRVLNSLLNERTGAVTAGLGAGRLAQTFEQLVSAGIVGGGPSGTSSLINAIPLPGGVQPGGAIAKGIQSEDIKQQIAAYSRVVAGINDIFTEAGKPNSPMGDLIKGLQTMTQGGFGRYDPAELTKIVRNMQAASQTTGMSLDQITQMSAALGGSLRQYGGPQLMAGPLATYSAAVRQSYINQGHGRARLEGTTPDEFRNIYAETVAAGLGSSQLNMIGALAYQAQLAPEGSPLALIGEGLRQGKTTIDIPGGRQINLLKSNQADLEKMFIESKLSPVAFMTQMQATELNKAAITRLPIAITQQAQREEFQQAVLHSPELRMLVGGDPAETMRTIKAISDAAQTPGVKGAADLAQRTAVALGKEGDPAFASRLAPILQLWSAQHTRFGGDAVAPWLAFKEGPDSLMTEADRQAKVIQDRAELADRLAHVARGNIMRHAMTAVSESGFGQGNTITEMIARGLGMARNEEIYGDPLSNVIRQSMPGAAGGAAAMGIKWLRNSVGTTPGMTIGGALSNLSAPAPGSELGGPEDGPPRPQQAMTPMAGMGPAISQIIDMALSKFYEKEDKEADDKASGKKKVDIKADIAKLEVHVAANGAMSAVLSTMGATAMGLEATKTMTGDGTAVPPGGP